MAVIVGNLRLPLGENEAEAIAKARKILKLPSDGLKNAYIVKASPDLRHRNAPAIVYTVGVELNDEGMEEAAVRAASSPSVTLRKSAGYAPQPGHQVLRGRPVIAGFGPAGMFAGLLLARAGYRPLIVERGMDVDTRVQDVERFWKTGELKENSNVQFGEGGAGTFSDGKLTTRINDRLCDTVTEELIRHGAPETVRRLARPHIGTDRLRGVVRAIRKTIQEHGGEIRFGTKLTGLVVSGGRLCAVELDGGVRVDTDALILAIGHSARDTFEMLLKYGIVLEPKPFSAGVRIEHLQSEVDRMLYGPLTGHPALPKGEYQLSLRQGEKAVYTFCMCPGGTVVAAASEEGGVVTNGMSEFARDGRNANAALVVSVAAFPTPMEGVTFQRKLEQAAFQAGGGGYRAPFQTVDAFLNGKSSFRTGRVLPSYPAGVTQAPLHRVLPEEISGMLKTGLAAFDRKMKGFSAGDAILTGVETRTSSPLRMTRTEDFHALGVDGLYPAGEGPGYAGGIVSAAVDGLRVAGAVIEKFAPLG